MLEVFWDFSSKKMLMILIDATPKLQTGVWTKALKL